MAAFSTELSGQNFLPSYSCIDNPGCGSAQGIWPENRGMLLYLAKIARTPYLTSHGPDANTVVTNPTSVPQGVPSQLTASINFAWSSNAFTQNVGAAEYYIDTPPWAGGTAIPMNGTFNSPTVAVNATINTASLSVGRHVIFVRGRGVNNFQGFQTWGPISAAFLDVIGGPTPTSVVSRKLHNGVPFDISLPLSGSSGVECRSGGATNDYQVIFTFANSVTFSSAALTAGAGSVSTSSGNGTATITVNLTGITNAQRTTVTLSAVNDGTSTGNVGVSIGMLVGDTNGDGIVNAGDTLQTRNHSGEATAASNFRSDGNTDGFVNSGDTIAVRGRAGTFLP